MGSLRLRGLATRLWQSKIFEGIDTVSHRWPLQCAAQWTVMSSRMESSFAVPMNSVEKNLLVDTLQMVSRRSTDCRLLYIL